MSDSIEINESDFNMKISMCNRTAGRLMSKAPEIPSVASNSMTIYAYTARITQMSELITSYRNLLCDDLEALIKMKKGLVEADENASKNF